MLRDLAFEELRDSPSIIVYSIFYRHHGTYILDESMDYLLGQHFNGSIDWGGRVKAEPRATEA